MGALYLIEGPGKQYIGITLRDFSERLNDHLTWGVRQGTSYLHNAMRKHGADKFTARILVIADNWDYLCDLERKAIVAYGTKAPAGYNATDGGDGVPGMDAETKQKHRVNTSIGTAKAWAEGRMGGREQTRATPEFKERHKKATSDGVKRMYADPILRAKTLAALTSDEKREKNRQASLKKWADPEYRAMMVAARTRPDRVAQMKAAAIARWQDPEFRAKQMAAFNRPEELTRKAEKAKAYHAKRRETA